MTEINVSTRISEELEKQLVDYMKTEHLEKSAAVRKLLFDALQEWREGYSLRLLKEGKVTLLKAAEIAGMNAWEFTSLLKRKKAQWVDEEAILKDLREFK